MRIPIYNIYIIALAALALIMPGCINPDINGIDNPKEIRLWADLGYTPGMSVTPKSTRGNESSTSGIINASTDAVLPIGMARVDEVYSPYYPGFMSCIGPIEAELGAPDASNSYIRQIEFKSSAQFFYNTTDYVKYVAWHPWKPSETGYNYNSSESATTVTMPITGDSDIMYGNVTTGSQTDGFDLMTFDHALCVYRIYVYSMQEEGSDTSVWGTLQDMEIENCATSCTLTLPTNGEGIFGIAYEGDETLVLSSPDNNIYFSAGSKIPAGLANRRLVSKCIVAPPTNGLLNISLSTTGMTERQRVSIASNFKPGHAYDIVLRFSNHGLINGDVSVEEWNVYEDEIVQDVEVDMFYNLSNYETANSYIVNSANYGYCFDGTIKGNGDNSLVGGSTTITPGYIDILWDDTPNITVNGVERKALTLDVNKLSEGRVLFHVQGDPNNKDNKELLSEGNVIIAAYDKQGGNILWTWHIWLTDRVKSQGYPNGYIVQDRNLGAVSSDNSGSSGSMDGLYYQWGRPTPFHKVASGVYGNVTKVPSSSSQVSTVEAAIAQPTTLYGSGDNTRHDWLSTQNNALWGYQNDYTDLKKTMYDPCPPGYMVADLRIWKNIAANEVNNGWKNNIGVQLSVAGNNVWYPFQGHIDADGTETNTRTSSRLWSSAIDLNGTNTPPYELLYTASKSSSASSANSYRNRALPVRCVSNHSTTIVTNLSAAQTSNCYMIHRTGYYKFKATVRGNGVGSLLPLGGTTTAEINGGLSTTFQPAKVDVLWWQGDFTEVTGNATDVTNFMPIQILNNGEIDEEGYVLFYVGDFHKGNVGLAAYDIDGEIMWSWHIWFTDKPADIVTGNYTLMDRYLGATHAPNTSNKPLTWASNNERLASYGFYYQWGRKDPIMGPPAYNSSNETVSNNKPKTSRYWVKNPTTGEWTSRTDIDAVSAALIPEVTKNPMKFYMSATEKGDNRCGWFPQSFADGYTNVALWGYAVKDYSIQGQTFSKTMHDPCPPGYRTPFHHAWAYVENNNNVGYCYGENEGNINFTNNNEGTFDNYGVVFNKTYFDRAWYPFVGYRAPKTGAYTNVGSSGYMLTGMPMGQYNCRTYIYTKTYAGESANSGSGGYGPAYAMPARCQKE